jgi:hypothetical protein
MKPNGEFVLARQWEYCCVICGRKIETYHSFSVEHLIPRSKTYLFSQEILKENVAPSHYSCNAMRGTMSILEANKRINKYLDTLGENKSRDWLNRSNAGRHSRKCIPNNIGNVIANWGNFCKIPDGSGNPKQFVL